LNAAHHAVDAHVMLIDDALNVDFLLGRQTQIAIEMLDDTARRKARASIGRKQTTGVKKVKAIAGDADEHSADEDGDHRKGRGCARPTR
jgi:hypothetical protein